MYFEMIRRGAQLSRNSDSVISLIHFSRLDIFHFINIFARRLRGRSLIIFMVRLSQLNFIIQEKN